MRFSLLAKIAALGALLALQAPLNFIQAQDAEKILTPSPTTQHTVNDMTHSN